MKTWFITGANRGLGLHIARAALAAGNNVVATARKPDSLEKALGDSRNFLALTLDVTTSDDASAAIKAAEARFGLIDVLVNNAGYGQLGWFEANSDEQIRAQFETNLFGPMRVTRAVLPLMRARRSGHVFTISSLAGLVSVAGGTIYSASKFAVEGWMEGLAEELRPLGIWATVVEPGFFKTDFLDITSVSYGANAIPDYAEHFAAFKTSLDRMNHNQLGDPAKLAAALLAIAEMKKPPVHWAAGSDAIAWVVDKANSLRANAEKYRALSASTDGEKSLGPDLFQFAAKA